jgi:hypothetical protein
MAVFGLSKLGRPFRPPLSFLSLLCTVVEQRLKHDELSTQHVALISSGLARSLGGPDPIFQVPTTLLDCYWAALHKGLCSMQDWEVELTAKSIARLAGPNNPPSPQWRDAMAQAGQQDVLRVVDETMALAAYQQDMNAGSW